MSKTIELIQAALKDESLDGWLFFDHHKRDPLSYKILGITSNVNVTRRWYYFIPADGEPIKLLHKLEPNILDEIEGQDFFYASWQEQHSKLKQILEKFPRIAMQYSPKCEIPYISTVDAGTVELIKSFGIQIKSSANLVQLFESQLTSEEINSHLEAGKIMDKLRAEAFNFIANNLDKSISEYDV